MTHDLEARLAGLAHTSGPEPDPATVGSDLTRGRGALRHRRTRQARVLSLGALATLGVAAAVAVGVGSPDPSVPGAAPSTPAVSSPAGPSGPPTSTPTLADPASLGLVAYRGAQQVGFDVDYVPKGFVLQGADNVSLAVARPDDTTGIFDFRHKIVVTVELVDTHGPLDPTLDPIVVQGHPGTISTSPNGTITLYYELDDERLAFVQAWNDVGLTEEGLRRFAEGLTISEDVETVS